ncbi:uncharacterized protein LOC134180013 [Corticium candelabrum]|uniref:uncharacterized protein LOC134180013 n=1 Tax=Corticium candelabrum TaxID=121492 RepID=UPI002E256683|nr:uncharacterized protein LOC134180013 [Corticium candelabrum]
MNEGDENGLRVEQLALLRSDRLVETVAGSFMDDDTDREIFGDSEDILDDGSTAHGQDRRSKLRLCLMASFAFGFSFYVYLSTVGVLPSQVLVLVGSKDKGKFLAAVVGAAGVITFLVSPLVGTLSDRLQTRFGKRSPIILICSIILCILMFGLAWAAPTLPGCQTDSCYSVNTSKPICSHDNDSVCSTADTENITLYGVYFIVYAAVAGLYAAIGTAWNGLIADVCPDDTRGFVSGMVGLFVLFGNAAGALWNVFYRTIGVWATYASVSVTFFVTVLICLFGAKEESSIGRVNRQPLNFKAGIKQYWKPLKNWDFFWVFMTRFLMQMGLYTIIGYLYYFMVDVVNLPKCMSPERATGLIMLPLLMAGGVVGIIAGNWSDRLQRRKPFVASAGIVMAIGCAGFFTWVRDFYPGIVLATFIGIGYGLYVTVDYALLLDVLPDKMSKGNDIAVWHQSLVLPQFLAVPIAGVVVDHLQKVGCKHALGYVVLFVITGFYFLLSGVFILFVRKVR